MDQNNSGNQQPVPPPPINFQNTQANNSQQNQSGYQQTGYQQQPPSGFQQQNPNAQPAFQQTQPGPQQQVYQQAQSGNQQQGYQNSQAGYQQQAYRPVQPNQAPQGYQQTAYAAYQNADHLNKPLGVGQYIGMFLLQIIPIVNIILLFVWAFGSDVNKNKKNYARAILILGVIGIILWILLYSVIMRIIFTALEYNVYN